MPEQKQGTSSTPQCEMMHATQHGYSIVAAWQGPCVGQTLPL